MIACLRPPNKKMAPKCLEHAKLLRHSKTRAPVARQWRFARGIPPTWPPNGLDMPKCLRYFRKEQGSVAPSRRIARGVPPTIAPTGGARPFEESCGHRAIPIETAWIEGIADWENGDGTTLSSDMRRTDFEVGFITRVLPATELAHGRLFMTS